MFKPKNQPRIGLSSSRRPNTCPKIILTDIFTVPHCNVPDFPIQSGSPSVYGELGLPICHVCETNLNTRIIDSAVNCPGYILLRLDPNNQRRSTLGGGDVDMYLKNNIQFSLLWIPSCRKVFWVTINLLNKSFAIAIVYNPPKMEITEHLEDFLEFVKQKFPKSGTGNPRRL